MDWVVAEIDRLWIVALWLCLATLFLFFLFGVAIDGLKARLKTLEAASEQHPEHLANLADTSDEWKRHL